VGRTEAVFGSESDVEVTSRWAPSSCSKGQLVKHERYWSVQKLTVPPFNMREVLIALSFSKVISAVAPDVFTLTSFPQNEKKSWSFSSVVSGAKPATWMVYPGTDAEVAMMRD